MEICKDVSHDYKEISPVEQIEASINLVNSLMKIPHYAKLTAPVIFMMEQKARTLGMHPLDALNGAMYPTKGGKIELSAEAMNGLIRSRGHSIKQHPDSTNDRCILIGTRADNGDTMTVSFSLEEARQAGLLERSPRNPDYVSVWLKYPVDMMFCRALSRLARRLFPDVIKGCYIKGEISEDSNIRDDPTPKHIEIPQQPVVLLPSHITSDQAHELVELFKNVDEEFKKTVFSYCENKGINTDFSNFPVGMHERILNSAKRNQKVITHATEHAPMAGVPQN